MDTLDTAIRLMVIGQIVVISLVLVARGPRAGYIPLVLLQAGVAAYLVKSSAALTAAVPAVEIPVFMLSTATPYLVWACAHVLFDFHRPPMWVMVLCPAASVAMCGFVIFTGSAPVPVHALSIGFSLFVVLHVIYSVVRGILDDLSEARRLFRVCFVACITLVAAWILFMELVFVGQPEPGWLALTNASLIAAVYLAIAVPLVTRPADLLPNHLPAPTAGTGRCAGASAPGAHQYATRV